ncbi:protein of unknown function [Paraburkholderia dioscoreae]|uniref:Uncharacterized protein n=1 Tax=Paraburkholderia dioscoreae TaxID=2604047 RepID=A0A5Q4YSP7_9BURK|nr:protein of unknown function [Paraburkholderia dioscoreae]
MRKKDGETRRSGSGRTVLHGHVMRLGVNVVDCRERGANGRH